MSPLFHFFLYIFLVFNIAISIVVHYPGPGKSWNRDFFHSNLTVDYDNYDYSKRNIAVIVNAQIYHMEVFASVVYYYYSLGYDVHAWVQPPWNYFQFKTRIDWIAQYIHHVVYLPHEVYNQTWKAKPSIPKHIKVLAYITGDFYADVKYMCRLGLHKAMFQRADRVLMVTHHADTLLNEMSSECHAPKCTAAFLASHVEKTAIQLHENTNTPYPAQTTYIFPVFEFPPILGIHINTTTPWTFMRHRKVIIQGQVSSSRRDYSALFDCLKKVEDAKYPAALKLTVMGQGAKNLHIPFATSSTLRVMDNLRFEDYFTQITRNDFVISFVPHVNITEYKGNRISSSVSAAILAETPILLPLSILSQYPCLNTSPVHLRIAGKSDCQSLQNALSIKYDDYIQMKKEIKYCKDLWISETKVNLQKLSNKKSYADTNESMILPPESEFQCREYNDPDLSNNSGKKVSL